MRVCFATNNAHKLEEVKTILGKRFQILSLKEAGFVGDIPETHETLEENSLEKAQFIFDKLKIPVFSDDSGLEVKQLGGKPGVHSAHYAGTRDASVNINKILEELGDSQMREAQFRAVITFINEGGYRQFEGVVKGRLATAIQGEGGFGYDPIFIPEGHEKTFAELSPQIKNSVSHRKRSVEKLANYLKSIL